MCSGGQCPRLGCLGFAITSRAIDTLLLAERYRNDPMVSRKVFDGSEWKFGSDRDRGWLSQLINFYSVSLESGPVASPSPYAAGLRRFARSYFAG